MSSDHRGLHKLDYVPQYEKTLADNLPPSFTQFADFFAGTQRLTTLGAMFADHITQTGLDVLNVGSGPFATEIFVKAMAEQSILAVDYTPEFEPFHALFQRDGHLQNTTFLRADINNEDFGTNRFDLIILHDILYESALDMASVITKLKATLKPGGMIFFDFVNARTAWIWTLLGRRTQFRRYDPRVVGEFLADAGFVIVDWRPTHGAKSLSARTVHRTLRLAGAANNYAVLARLPGGT